MKDINYLELFRSNKNTNQYWFAELKCNYSICCGFGYIDNEFSLDTLEKMTNASKLYDIYSVYSNVEGYYIFDTNTDIRDSINKLVPLDQIYNKFHPEDDSFILIPKSDIVKTWFIIKK